MSSFEDYDLGYKDGVKDEKERILKIIKERDLLERFDEDIKEEIIKEVLK
jgi:hypothetical protein